MDMLDLIRCRRTIRKFEQKPLSDGQLMSYIDAARLAPSAANLQPLKYIVVQNQAMTEQVFPLLKWAGYLKNYAPNKDERPVAYIVVCFDNNIRSGYADLDAGAAVENITLAALSDGVGSCWLASADRKKLAALLDIPQNLEISSVVALGYPKESPKAVAVLSDIQYYLDGETLCVPKRSLEEVVIKTV